MIKIKLSKDKNFAPKMNKLLMRYQAYVGLSSNPIKTVPITKKAAAKRKKQNTQTYTWNGFTMLRGVTPSKTIRKTDKDGNVVIKQRKRASLLKVAKILDDKYNWLADPFQNTKNQAALEVVIAEIINHLNTKMHAKRILNTLIAAVRNPILRKDWGETNSSKVAKRKGFNWPMVATGQFVKSITCAFIKRPKGM